MATAALMALWLFAGVIATGWGRLFVRCRNTALQTADDHFLVAWLGWGALIAFLQAWHLFAAIDRATVAIVLLVSLGSYLANPPSPRWPEALRHWRGGAALLIIAAVWFAEATWALQPMTSYDTANYHLSAMRWATEFPVIRGIANLHVRLGFNSSASLHAALIERMMPGAATHLAVSTLICWLVAYVMWSWMRVGAAGDRMWRLFAGACVPVIVGLSMGKEVRSLSTDHVSAAVGLVCWLTTARIALTAERRTFPVSALLVLAAAWITIKMSAIPGALACIAVVLAVRGDLRSLTAFGQVARAVRIAIAFAAVTVLVWIARTIIMTGYPLFPLSRLAFPVDWRVPHATADALWFWIGLVRARPLWTSTSRMSLALSPGSRIGCSHMPHCGHSDGHCSAPVS